MLNSKENMTNIKNSETRVTTGDSRTITGVKHGDWSGYQRRDRKLHHMTLSNTAVIPGLHKNIFKKTLVLINVSR